MHSLIKLNIMNFYVRVMPVLPVGYWGLPHDERSKE